MSTTLPRQFTVCILAAIHIKTEDETDLRFIIPPGNIPIMASLRTVTAVLLIIVVLAFAGCTRPENTSMQVTGDPVITETTLPANTALPVPAATPETTVFPAVSTVPGSPASRAATTVPSVQPLISGGYIRYTGPEYSVEYPSEWSTSVSVLPLYEYRHTMHGCTAAPAFNLDQELRSFSSPDGGMQFHSGIVRTERDIRPRNFQGSVVYEDIVNSVLGNPESCANSPEGAFTIAGVSQVPLDGVSYTGIRADYARINATGFTEGKGTAYIVTGKVHSGVFIFYRSSDSEGMQASLGDYLFGSLRLDPGF